MARRRRKANDEGGFIRALANRLGLMQAAGLTFGGKRDMYEALGYKRTLEPKDFRQRYDRGDIAARIVEALPRATWRAGAEVYEDDDPKVKTAFEQAWDAMAERLQLWPMFLRADILAGLGRYSVILIGAPGKLEEPLKKLRGPQDIVYLAPFSEDDAEIAEYDNDPESARFGQATVYILKRMTPDKKMQMTRRVHWTRMIHIADGLLDDRVFGKSRLERVWNRLDDLDKVLGGGAEAFWKRVHQGMHLDLDKDMILEPDAKEEMKTQVDEFEHGMRRVLRTRGVEVQMLGSDVANFKDPMDAVITVISGAVEIPKRILVGSERGELSSAEDKTNWDERVMDRRNDYASPVVVRQFVDRMVELNALPTPKQYKVYWPEIAKLNDLEKSQVATAWADLNTKMGETVVIGEEIRDRVLGLPPLEGSALDNFRNDDEA